jgi:hypothetical protein
MPRDIAKNTLAAAKPLDLGTNPTALKGALAASNRDDLFRLNLLNRSSLNLNLSTGKGGKVGVQLFSLKDAKNKVLKAIGRKEFSELKPRDLKKFLQPLAKQAVAGGKDGIIQLDLQAGEYYLRIYQRQGSPAYGLKLAAPPVPTAPQVSSADPKPKPSVTPSAPNLTNGTPQPVVTSPFAFSRRWLQQFGTTGNDYTYGTTVDQQGNLYVAGVANATNGPAGDGFVAKYKADGTQEWRRSIDTPGSDVAFNVAVDAEGSYYVTGATVTGSGSSTNSDAFVSKYSSTGVQQWIKTIATTVQVAGANRNALDAGLGIVLDGSSLFVSGLVGAYPAPSLGKAFIAKFDAATGTAATSFGGAGTGRVEFGTADASAATGLTVSNGRLYTTGITGGTVTLSGNSIQPSNGFAFVSAFDENSGAALWNQTLSSGSKPQDYARGIAVSGSDVYITGQTSGTLPSGTAVANTSAGGKSDGFLAKYNAQTVSLQWLKQFGSNGADASQAIAVDNTGRCCMIENRDRSRLEPG